MNLFSVMGIFLMFWELLLDLVTILCKLLSPCFSNLSKDKSSPYKTTFISQTLNICQTAYCDCAFTFYPDKFIELSIKYKGI